MFKYLLRYTREDGLVFTGRVEAPAHGTRNTEREEALRILRNIRAGEKFGCFRDGQVSPVAKGGLLPLEGLVKAEAALGYAVERFE